MASFSAEFDEVTRTLLEAYGPGSSSVPDAPERFRNLLIVYLSQQRGRQQADRVIESLDREGWSDDPSLLAGADPSELAEAFRDARGQVPAGLPPTLRRLAEWVVTHGGMAGLADLSTSTLREELRSIRGLGPQTVDRILLEALGRPTFPVSRSDYRVLIRHAWIDPSADYDEAREMIESSSGGDPGQLLQLSDWMSELARPCRVSAPRCDRCPMQPFLPEGGPLEPD